MASDRQIQTLKEINKQKQPPQIIVERQSPRSGSQPSFRMQIETPIEQRTPTKNYSIIQSQNETLITPRLQEKEKHNSIRFRNQVSNSLAINTGLIVVSSKHNHNNSIESSTQLYDLPRVKGKLHDQSSQHTRITSTQPAVILGSNQHGSLPQSSHSTIREEKLRLPKDAQEAIKEMKLLSEYTSGLSQQNGKDSNRSKTEVKGSGHNDDEINGLGVQLSSQVTRQTTYPQNQLPPTNHGIRASTHRLHNRSSQESSEIDRILNQIIEKNDSKQDYNSLDSKKRKGSI